MIRIAITPAALEALLASVPGDPEDAEPERSPDGGFFVWLHETALARLEALKQPSEGLSETILRLADLERSPARLRKSVLETVMAVDDNWELWELKNMVRSALREAEEREQRWKEFVQKFEREWSAHRRPAGEWGPPTPEDFKREFKRQERDRHIDQYAKEHGCSRMEAIKGLNQSERIRKELED